MALDKAAEAEIKRLYLETNVTLVKIGEQFGIAASSISRLARTRGWPMRWERMGRSPRTMQSSTPKARAALVHRLCIAIDKKLDQMETNMASGKLGSSDYERDAKAVGSMINGMEKVAVAGADADKEQKPKSAGPAAATEADRIRREIVERFERIQRRRNAERGSC